MSDIKNCDNETTPVDAKWLEQILTNHYQSKVSVKDFIMKPWHDTLSDIRTVQVTHSLSSQKGEAQEENRTVYLIIKLLPIDPFIKRFIMEAQFDLREIKFYTKIVSDIMEFQKTCLPSNVPAIELPIPHCYHASHEESQLVLADVRAHGYERIEFMKGLTLEQAESALDAISRIHALTLAMRIKQNVDLNEKYQFLFQTSETQASDAYQQLVEKGLFLLSNLLKDQKQEIPAIKCLKEIHPKLINVISTLLTPQEPLKLITHTDFWSNNLMFNKANECCILDWQMVTCSRPTTDIALLIISSLPTELRRTKTLHLLDKYWEKFTHYSSRLGMDIKESFNYTRQHLQQDYEKSKLLAILLCIGSVDLAMGNSMTEQRVLDLLHDLYEEGVFNLQLD